MIRIFHLSFFFFIAIRSFSQELPNLVYSTKITTLAYFNKGESKKFHVRSTNSRVKNNEKSEEKISEYDLNVKVLDSTETSYRFEMVYTNFSTPKELNDMEKELAGLVQHYKIIYSTDENGIFAKVENTAELKTTTANIITLIKKKLMEKLKTQEEKDQFNLVFKGFETMMTDDENIESLFIDDILALHGMYGMELKLNQKEEIELEYPALNNITLKGTGTITAKEINKATKEAKIEVIEKPNESEVQNYLEVFFKTLVQGIDENATFDPKKFNIECKNEQLMFMRLDTGWMRKIIMTNQTTITYETDKVKQSEKKEYTMF